MKKLSILGLMLILTSTLSACSWWKSSEPQQATTEVGIDLQDSSMESTGENPQKKVGVGIELKEATSSAEADVGINLTN